MLYNLNTVRLDKTTRSFIFFWRQTEMYGVFSQWYMSDFSDGEKIYNCAEQYMMYHKSIIMGDFETAELILKEKNQKRIKDLGRCVKNFNEQLWNDNKYDVVLRASLLKFGTNEELKKILLGTNEILVEASPYDDIWGIKMGVDDKNIMNPNCWKGENLLGFALMEARYILKAIN